MTYLKRWLLLCVFCLNCDLHLKMYKTSFEHMTQAIEV